MSINYSDLPPKMQEQVKIKIAIQEARKRQKAAYAAMEADEKKGNKYHAEKTVIDGISFDSRREANRYAELSMLERNGDISDLQRQVAYELVPKQTREDGKAERPITYRADFVYKKNGETVVEDVKGYKNGAAYAIFSIKRKLMLYIHGITVKEV